MMPCRSESWCVGLSLRVALLWCDAVIVFDHASTDRTADIVKEVMGEVETGRVFYTREEDPTWREMEHRQWMLEAARKIGATHLAIIDADEVLTGNLVDLAPLLARAAAAISQHSQPETILELPGYNLRGGINQYHSNGIWSNRWFSTAFADAPDLGWSGDKFHSREPGPRKLQSYRPIQQGQGGILHLWGASERRLRAKHRLYRVSERVRWPDKPVAEIERMYSWATHGEPGNSAYGTPDTWTYASVPESWWKPYEQWMKYLDLENEPWQNAEADRIIAEHGKSFFDGLTV